MAEQATLVVIKPDAIRRGLTGVVLSYIDALHLDIIGVKAMRVDRATAEEHYKHIRSKPFFEETVDYMQGKLHGTSYVLALVFWGENAIERVREVAGATHPEKAEPASIRGALGRMLTTGLMENVLHASSDPLEADREIRLWFKPEELLRPLIPSGARAEER
jgi:nucleoside-diphosphate kinase